MVPIFIFVLLNIRLLDSLKQKNFKRLFNIINFLLIFVVSFHAFDKNRIQPFQVNINNISLVLAMDLDDQNLKLVKQDWGSFKK